jgi:tRNA-2-methylthio-N6-dimethylallyladenosine synthase
MNRGYTREWYLDRIEAIRRIIPGCAISTDIISGFCDETDEEHNDTIDLMNKVKWDFAYMYKYSERPKTLAERRFEDNVPDEVKGKRLTEIIDLQQEHSKKANAGYVGMTQKILVEGTSKRSEEDFAGRNDQNVRVVFPKGDFEKGDYIMVKITDSSAATLKGEVVEILK